jgi:outer membrane autotransporter protein
MTQSRLGAKLAYPVKLQSGGVLTPDVHMYWLHDFGSNQLTLTYTSADLVGGSTFFAVGPQSDRDTINLGVGVTFAKGAGWSFGGGYDYAGRSSLSGHNFYVDLKLQF